MCLSSLEQLQSFADPFHARCPDCKTAWQDMLCDTPALLAGSTLNLSFSPPKSLTLIFGAAIVGQQAPNEAPPSPTFSGGCSGSALASL